MNELVTSWVGVVGLLHGALLALVPDWLALAAWAFPMVWLVMGLYRRFSPQAALSALTQEMGVLQRQMLSLQTTPEQAAEATGRYLRLSLRRLQQTIIPVLLSSLPVWPVWAGLSVFYASAPFVFDIGPMWIRHWLSVFCFFSLLYSAAFKILWRLK